MPVATMVTAGLRQNLRPSGEAPGNAYCSFVCLGPSTWEEETGYVTRHDVRQELGEACAHWRYAHTAVHVWAIQQLFIYGLKNGSGDIVAKVGTDSLADPIKELIPFVVDQIHTI